MCMCVWKRLCTHYCECVCFFDLSGLSGLCLRDPDFLMPSCFSCYLPPVHLYFSLTPSSSPHSPSLAVSLPSLMTAPVGFLWVFLSCFPLPYPMQFSLYQHLISTEWVVLCTETNRRRRHIIWKNARSVYLSFPTPSSDPQLLFIPSHLSFSPLLSLHPLVLLPNVTPATRLHVLMSGRGHWK